MIMCSHLSTFCGDEKKVEIGQHRHLLIALGLLIVIVNVAILFIVIPGVSYRLASFYSQDLHSDGYNQLAANLAEGNGYRFYPDTARTLMREPGYPIFLAGLLLVFGRSFAVVKLANMCLALTAAWLMTPIARKLSPNRALTVLPSLLFLFHPGILIAESRGGVEILFTLLIVLFMLTLYRAIDKGRWWDYAISGAVLGLAVLVRSTPLLFPICLLAYFMSVGRLSTPKCAICRNMAVMVAAISIVISPWVIRNYLLTRQFVPTASVLGVSAHAGQYICMHRADDKVWVLLDREAAVERGKLAHQLGYRFKEDDLYYQVFYSSEDEVKFSRYLLNRVVNEYERSPLLCARCIGYNLFNVWFAGKTWESTRASLLVQLPYLIFGIAGAVLCVKRGQAKVIGPMVLLTTYVVAVYVPILAQARYSVPLIPLLSILASTVFVEIRRKVVTVSKIVAFSLIAHQIRAMTGCHRENLLL